MIYSINEGNLISTKVSRERLTKALDDLDKYISVYFEYLDSLSKNTKSLLAAINNHKLDKFSDLKKEFDQISKKFKDNSDPAAKSIQAFGNILRKNLKDIKHSESKDRIEKELRKFTDKDGEYIKHITRLSKEFANYTEEMQIVQMLASTKNNNTMNQMKDFTNKNIALGYRTLQLLVDFIGRCGIQMQSIKAKSKSFFKQINFI